MIKTDISNLLTEINNNKETEELFDRNQPAAMVQIWQKLREQRPRIRYAGLLPSLTEESVKHILREQTCLMMQSSDLQQKNLRERIIGLTREMMAVYFSMFDDITEEYIKTRINDLHTKYECLDQRVRDKVIAKVRSALDPCVNQHA